MSTDKGTPVESLETWLLNKPFWEQYVWKLNLENESLTDEDVDLCYKYLSEYLGLIDPVPGTKPEISFKNEIFTDTVNTEDASDSCPQKKKIIEVKDFFDVNAISGSCSIKLGSNLTLIYGENGSGKSGVSRLLCNACFSRGEREILPNVKVASIPEPQAKATFVINDGSGSTQDIEYSLGDNIDDLKCFSVFDSESVLIHLDQSNNVNFTPAQIKIFDKVAETISKIEEKLLNEKNEKKMDNPFTSMFLSDDATSDTALFCKGISASTEVADFLKHANFNTAIDEPKIADLIKQIDEKKKLDITKKKAQLASDRQNLTALKSTLQSTIDRFTEVKRDFINKIISDIAEKKKIVETLSIQSFNDGVIKTIGSLEWKALITTAKAFYDNEKVANENTELDHCILCHQELSSNAKILFQKYWQFLESKAEAELVVLISQQKTALENLKSAKTLYPKFLATDAGVKILNEENSTYLSELKVQFSTVSDVLNDWIDKLEKSDPVSTESVPTINLEKITEIINAKTTEESKLVDPSVEIATLTAKLNSLKHRKEVTTVKDAALEYLSFLKWSSKTGSVSFSGIKMAITKKRTESFLVRVGNSYRGVFNQELASLGCDFNLVMNTSGERGNTVKEYRLDFAEDYNPSQILSEGEQNACSLADFLTEIQLDNKNCGIIFDDPVTSLDHKRKDKIAERLTKEADQRQVLILTHDMVFMSQLVKYANKFNIPFGAHWMKKVDGIPGCVEDNASPKLATLANLKTKAQEAVKDFNTLDSTTQEIHLGSAFDYLRSACEALIEEVLFAGTIQRYDDHIKVQNLEEVVFDKDLALKITDLHGRVSGFLLAHNRSDLQRENIPQLSDFESFQKEFNELETSLRGSLKTARSERSQRKEEKVTAQAGW
jgi:energy-coupling factor transporter ATP-binding protein EcfA2